MRSQLNLLDQHAIASLNFLDAAAGVSTLAGSLTDEDFVSIRLPHKSALEELL
ncbi:hypothetical protein O9929_01660 [Vibrio lentus]|nr:hypothetical protein [Vibrio lentus]